LEIEGGRHEIFSIVPTGLVDTACRGDIAVAFHRFSVSR